jgi:hypothetical protein
LRRLPGKIALADNLTVAIERSLAGDKMRPPLTSTTRE